MDIYWIQNREQRGPLPEVEVCSMLENGLIAEDAVAWHVGCSEWMPIRDLPAMQHLSAQNDGNESAESIPAMLTAERNREDAPACEMPPPVEDAAEHAENATEKDGLLLVVPYPYVRLLGRLADFMIYMMFYCGALRLLNVGFNPNLFPGASYESLLYICLPLVLIETVLVSVLGSTLGKAMLGCGVCDYLGRKLNFGTAFKRSLFVMFMGCGCFIMPLGAAIMFFSWWWVRRIGFTPWDRKLGTTAVLLKPLTVSKVLVVLILMFLCAYAMGEFLQPWLPQIEAYMQVSKPS